MAITDHSDEIQAFLTSQAREYLARAINGELSFQAVGFSVGRGGYEPTDPLHVIPVTGAELNLSDQVYPDTTGYASFQQIDNAAGTPTVVYNCRLASTITQSKADYGLGELGVWAKILHSNNPSEVNQVFLMALAHFPIKAKTRRDTILFRVTVQY